MGAGLLAGLAWTQMSGWRPNWDSTPRPEPVAEARVDPYAEARRSRAILEAQEGAPAPVLRRGAVGSGPAVRAHGHVRVIDGDTFDLDGQRIRIADIDTPETHPARCAYEAELGARATERLRTWLALGPFDLIAIDRDEDRFGRKLRIVSRNGRTVGDLLVAEGLARRYQGARRSWCG